MNRAWLGAPDIPDPPEFDDAAVFPSSAELYRATCDLELWAHATYGGDWPDALARVMDLLRACTVAAGERE